MCFKNIQIYLLWQCKQGKCIEIDEVNGPADLLTRCIAFELVQHTIAKIQTKIHFKLFDQNLVSLGFQGLFFFFDKISFRQASRAIVFPLPLLFKYYLIKYVFIKP